MEDYDSIIVIPYRNRLEHLNYFLENTYPLIKKNMNNCKIIIIEQDGEELFNRGKLLNIGFKIYNNKSKYFITQDVDINPCEKVINELYNKELENDEILGILNSPCITLGGITKFSNKLLFEINGFPNNLWGWGVEDKVLHNRAVFYNKKIIYNYYAKTEEADKFFKKFEDNHDRKTSSDFNKNTSFEYNVFNNLNKIKKQELIDGNGLNNIEYKILGIKKINEMIDMILVKI